MQNWGNCTLKFPNATQKGHYVYAEVSDNSAHICVFALAYTKYSAVRKIAACSSRARSSWDATAYSSLCFAFWHFATFRIVTIYHVGCNCWNTLSYPAHIRHVYWNPPFPRPYMGIYGMHAGTSCLVPPTCSIVSEAPVFPCPYWHGFSFILGNMMISTLPSCKFWLHENKINPIRTNILALSVLAVTTWSAKKYSSNPYS